MVWALWQDSEHRAIKMHLHFEVFKGVPCDATISPAACSEPAHLQAILQPGRLYVMDRGFDSYELFQAILAAGSSFIGRVQDSTKFALKDERPLTNGDRAAGVVRDALLFHLGTRTNPNAFYHSLRLVIVRRLKPDHSVEEIWLITDRLDLPAELIALAYRYRWTVEVFFRVLKGGCKIEELQFHREDRLQVCLAMYLIVAWRVLYVLKMGRECPEMRCDAIFSEAEWKSVYVIANQTPAPKRPPTMAQILPMIAGMGGYLGRKHDGPPGPKTMWIGLQRMRDFATAWTAIGPATTKNCV